MEIFKDDTGKIYNWVVSSLDNGEEYPNDLTLGLLHGNIIIGGVIYSKVNEDVFLSIYTTSPKWCSKKTLSILFDIPFSIFDAKKAKCAVSKDNKSINKLLKGLGLQQEHLKRARADGSLGKLFSIDKNNLIKKRWFKI
ncbi:MAG: hypothetical protein Unbinned6284contig1004_1 [Prokaryotic dsDNA virus sp.]|nr:MAG: hypothetical protein Unbinned6284contig1004_1 [Prokaryotic dsDNA virus sp.]|tara:strand:+ start:18398 stop:18814 length:417 start_codon:yes stop_codon:yes gene_type:complete